MQASNDTARNVARWVALGALFLIPLTPLLVADTFFFPFITGKAFYARILIEIAVGAWVVLALLDREYRPRVSWVGIAAVSFVAWMFLADLFAPNAAKAFWSNFERMEGWVLLIHLLGFFFASSAVLRVEKKWRAWFLSSLAVSAVVSCYALLQLAGALPIHQGSTRIDASLGNSAYLAIYLLFNVFIALWLASTSRRIWLTWVLIVLAAVEGVLIFFTETRGTVLGLALGFLLMTGLAALTAGKRARRRAAAAFAAIVILAGGFYLARDSSLVQQNHVLQRIASISLADGATRFAIWHMAFQGVAARPIVGWGQEGFNYVFNTYYDPSLFRQEQWFDRAHNAFIDWLTAGGIPAFLLYLSLFASAIALLWRSSELSRPERVALTAALAGYAVHNLFVFDNLYSYIYFFAILALIDSQVSRPYAPVDALPVLDAEQGILYAFPIATVTTIATVWMLNMPGIQVATKLITAISPTAPSIAPNLAAFADLAAHPAFAAQEIREQMVSFASSAVQDQGVPPTEKEQAVSLALTEMKKQVAAYPRDARAHLELSYAYRSAGDSANALTEVLAAAELSPKKETIWLEAGALAWERGDAKAARSYFDTAYALGPQFADLAAYAAAGAIGTGDSEKADAILLSAYGTTTIDSDVLAAAYYRAHAWQRLIGMWEARTRKPGAGAQTWFGLAAAYYAAGDHARAVETLHEAVKRFPDAAASAADAIAQIRGGK